MKLSIVAPKNHTVRLSSVRPGMLFKLHEGPDTSVFMLIHSNNPKDSSEPNAIRVGEFIEGMPCPPRRTCISQDAVVVAASTCSVEFPQ